jgi:hypothetical protein
MTPWSIIASRTESLSFAAIGESPEGKKKRLGESSRRGYSTSIIRARRIMFFQKAISAA